MSPDKTLVVSDPWEGHNKPVRRLDWSPNGLEIASGSEDGTIRRWNPHTGQQIGLPVQTGHGQVHTIKYSPQGDQFMSGGADEIIRVWSKDGELLIEIKIKGHDNWVYSLCWSKDGAHIFSGSEDDTIRKWRSIVGKGVFVLHGHSRAVISLCISSDERHLFRASADYSIFSSYLGPDDQSASRKPPPARWKSRGPLQAARTVP